MRIRLEKGKQKELILEAKGSSSWKELSKKIQISEGYLRNNLRIEKVLLNQELYNRLNKIIEINFDKYIIERLEDNWGRSKGGLNSSKNIKKLIIPDRDESLAEIIGIILGDGNLNEFKKGKKIRCYSMTIAGNMQTDKDYMTKYIPLLFEKVFNEKGNLTLSKISNVGYFKLHGKELINILNNLGLKSGNKKENNQGIPNWIKEDKKFLSKCIRGLIDTDGSIHKISKKHKNLRIDYTSHIPNLLSDVRNGLIKLGFNPSKIISNRHFFLSGRKEVNKYIKEIGFGNKKNLNRINHLQEYAPIV